MAAPYLFLMSTYNDMDNQAPLVWKMAQSGNAVRILFLDRNANMDVDEDPRIQFLKKEARCQVDYYYALPEFFLRFPNRPFLKSPNPLLVKILRFFILVMSRRVWTDAWAEKILKKIKPPVVIARSEIEDGTLESKFVHAARRLDIPVLGASHGPGVYSNVDRSVTMPRPFRPVEMTSPTHTLCTYVVSTTPSEKALWEKEGFQPMEKILVRGSARYCDEWAAVNKTIYKKYSPRKEDRNKLKILFFMPHWGAHVDQDKTLSGIESIAGLDFVHLVIKEHTREGAGNIPKPLKAEFAGTSNVEVIESTRAVSTSEWIRAGFRTRHDFNFADSTPLVGWADAVVCFGTGIGMEALAQNKPLINPVYMYTYASVYDVYGAGMIAQTPEELLEAIRSLRRDLKAPYSSERFRKAILFGEKAPHDVLESHRALLVSMARKETVRE